MDGRRGRNSRSHKPGYEPWYVNAAEARFLQIALEQLLHVADRYAEDEDYPPEFPGEKLLFRVPEANKEGVIVWRDENSADSGTGRHAGDDHN